MKSLGFTTLLVPGLLTAVQLHAAEVKDWPGLGNAPFLKEQWPATRILVWAKPGISESALIPANWIEYESAADYASRKDGRPATTGPDANTDIALPDAPAGQPYIVGYMLNDQYPKPIWPPTLSCRHLTIGSGAALDGGIGFKRGQLNHGSRPEHDRSAAIGGNVTVRDGGYLYGRLYLVGDRHTWFSVGKSPEPLGRSILVRKARAASATIMARQFDLVDGVTVESGRLVLAPGASLRINATSQARIDLKKVNGPDFWQYEPYVWVHDQAALELQAGSLIGRVKPPAEIAPDLRIEGLLQIGRAGTAMNEPPAVIELTQAKGDGKYLNQPGGIYIHSTAEIRNLGSLSITVADPNPNAASTGTSIFLEKPVDLGKVSIDYLRAGGIAATDPAAARKSFATATFGKHCAATGDALYSKIEMPGFRGGMGTVEFVDGLSTECEILFPLGDRLIVRSKGNRITQSFDLKSICAVAIGGKRTEYNPKRALTAAEQELRKVNSLWADVPDKGQIGNYAKQIWPKVPLMVWRHPGESGSRFVAANWLDETGRPYLELPVNTDDEGLNGPEADVLLPAADTYYQIVGQRGMWRMRQLTIENNVHLFASYNICGNLWMKDGSRMQAPWFGRYCNDTPNLHRFLRVEGLRIDEPEKAGRAPMRGHFTLSQWGRYQAASGATIEVIGTHLITDQFSVGGEGTVIIAENSHLGPGNRTAFAIMPEATVVLLQDARIGCETIAADKGHASVWVGGTLIIGTPERPITRDMIFAVAGMEEKFINREPTENIRCPGVSFLVGKKGRLMMHTVDPTKARLVFKMHDSEKARENGKRYGNPQGILLNFLGKAELNGVVFDNILEGGIMVTPEQKATWKNVSYGPHNLTEPARLYWNPEN